MLKEEIEMPMSVEMGLVLVLNAFGGMFFILSFVWMSLFVVSGLKLQTTQATQFKRMRGASVCAAFVRLKRASFSAWRGLDGTVPGEGREWCVLFEEILCSSLATASKTGK